MLKTELLENILGRLVHIPEAVFKATAFEAIEAALVEALERLSKIIEQGSIHDQC